MIDRYTKSKKALLKLTPNSMTVAPFSLEHCLANFGIPSKLLTDICSQFLPKSWVAVCCTVGVDNITTEYYPQMNGQAECFNSTVVLRLHYYVSQDQTACDKILFATNVTYRARVHRYRKGSVFRLILAWTSPGHVIAVPKSPALPSDLTITLPLYARSKLIRWATSLRKEAEKNLE